MRLSGLKDNVCIHYVSFFWLFCLFFFFSHLCWLEKKFKLWICTIEFLIDILTDRLFNKVVVFLFYVSSWWIIRLWVSKGNGLISFILLQSYILWLCIMQLSMDVMAYFYKYSHFSFWDSMFSVCALIPGSSKGTWIKGPIAYRFVWLFNLLKRNTN